MQKETHKGAGLFKELEYKPRLFFSYDSNECLEEMVGKSSEFTSISMWIGRHEAGKVVSG